jgi:hypothetical protein
MLLLTLNFLVLQDLCTQRTVREIGNYVQTKL